MFFESWNQKHGQRGRHGQHGQQGHYKQRQFPTRGASETTFVYKDAIQVFLFTVIYVPDLFGIRHLRKKVLDGCLVQSLKQVRAFWMISTTPTEKYRHWFLFIEFYKKKNATSPNPQKDGSAEIETESNAGD